MARSSLLPWQLFHQSPRHMSCGSCRGWMHILEASSMMLTICSSLIVVQLLLKGWRQSGHSSSGCGASDTSCTMSRITLELHSGQTRCTVLVGGCRRPGISTSGMRPCRNSTVSILGTRLAHFCWIVNIQCGGGHHGQFSMP